MRQFFKAVLAAFVVTSAFFLGFHVGRSKEQAKIPNFQEDIEAKI